MEYLHKVSGIYSSSNVANTTRDRLIERGFAAEQIIVMHPDDPSVDVKIEPEGDSVLKEVVKDGVLGGAIGGGVGALGAVGLMAANVSLFLAAPLIAPLAIIGWGAGVGAMAGASTGSGLKEGRFADIVKTALNNGKYVLIAHAATEGQTQIAQEILSATVSEADDVQSL